MLSLIQCRIHNFIASQSGNSGMPSLVVRLERVACRDSFLLAEKAQASRKVPMHCIGDLQGRKRGTTGFYADLRRCGCTARTQSKVRVGQKAPRAFSGGEIGRDLWTNEASSRQ
jgi:hypothetical protein